MKDQLTTLLASALKYLVGLAVSALVGKGILTADTAVALGPDIAAAIASLAGVIAALIVAIVQHIWRQRAKETKEGNAAAEGERAAASLPAGYGTIATPDDFDGAAAGRHSHGQATPNSTVNPRAESEDTATK